MSAKATDSQLEMLQRRWAQDPSPHVTLQLADVHRQRGDLAAALPILEKGLEAHPGHVSVQVALGRYLLESGDASRSAAVLRQVVDKDPGHLVANKLLVRAHLALGDRRSAGDRLELYAVLNDNDPELGALRTAVEGQLSSLEPPLPETFEAPPPATISDLASVAQPGRRSLSGRLAIDPFAELTADPLRAAPLPSFFTFESPAETAPEWVLDSTPEVRSEPEPEVVGEPEPAVETPLEIEELTAEAQEPVEVGAEEEPSGADVTAPSLEPAEEVEAPAAPREIDSGSGATATLGALYLAQGHLDDARRTFERVLERDGDDAEARAGLEEIERRLGHVQVEVPVAGIHDAKIARLEQYLARIRAAAQRLSA